MENIFVDFVKKIMRIIFIICYHAAYNTFRMFVPYEMRAKNIKSEIVLVTSAGKGLAKSVAKELAALGATLVLWDEDETTCNQTKQEIEDMGGKAYAFKCDICDKEEITKVAQEVKETVGEVTMLVNNAGTLYGKSLIHSEESEIEETFNKNNKAHILTTKVFLESMLKNNRGHIVTIANSTGFMGATGFSDYCTSNFALVGFNESLDNELTQLEKTGIKTTVICPYYNSLGMCDALKSKNVPILDDHFVTAKMVHAILTDQKYLLLPRIMYFIVALKHLLPNESLKFVSNTVIEMSNTAEDYIGRSKDAFFFVREKFIRPTLCN